MSYHLPAERGTEIAEGSDGMPYLVLPDDAPELSSEGVRELIEQVRR